MDIINNEVMSLEKEEKKRNKFESNKKYFTICIYAFGLLVAGAIAIKLIFSWEDTTKGIGNFVSALSPFLIGFFIAYLLNPAIKAVDYYIFNRIFHIKSRNIREILAMLVTYLLVIGLIIVSFVFLIPQIGESITDLINRLPEWINETSLFLESLTQKNPNADLAWMGDLINENLPKILDTETIKQTVMSLVPQVIVTTMSVVKWVSNIIIAIIVSCYMIRDRHTLGTAMNRLLHAVVSPKRADSIIKTAGTCNAIFSGFISGKTLDSFIIGVLCFIFMSILQLPYALLISLIVGITNMIPYFGPFIGAVPGALIILLISPIKVIVYLILILVLQQFDGLYLGPKILGDSTGLRPIWIIFAITIGGAMMGFIGMFLGVPCVAVISYLMGEWIDKRLDKKEIDHDSLKIQPGKRSESGWRQSKKYKKKRWSQNGIFIKAEEKKENFEQDIEKNDGDSEK